ncbi:MAG: class I SAM-dependent methyltransferase [Desulfobulbaceae bacterium]|jgi:tRNA (cmo5U34)-methyltransferase|nr:class I SAM-dependent methyltransferase [Desulfobulbaceae bacterium]
MSLFATSLSAKSTPEEIRQRFDNDVERFSNLETGQVSTIDAPLALELIAQAAVAATPAMRRILDIGCGAGNNSIKIVRAVATNPDCDLLDLSGAMLTRAKERVSRETTGKVSVFQGDFRLASLPDNHYDVVVAAAVLHHLRDDADWFSVFDKIFRLLRPGGSFWLSDLVSHEIPALQSLMWRRYGDYLATVGGPDYRDGVFASIDREDSPRPLTFQLDLLRRVGFTVVDALHKNSCFAVFGGRKPS